jgi:L-iditol 2-dehydrogenase
MKAAFLAGPRQLAMREVAPPAVPVDGVLVDVKACGVCGSDLRRWKEGPPAGSDGIVPGHEIGGIVTAAGPLATAYRVGQHLAIGPDVHCGRCYYCQRGLYNLCDHLEFLGITPGYPGGLSEQIALDGRILANGIVHPLPDDMTFEQGALAEPCSSVLAAHDKAATSLSDTVLIMGGGPIGCLHIIVARARGARVIVSEPNAGRRDLARRFAPDAVLDPFRDDLPARISELTNGIGVDIAVCANPVAVTQTQAVQLVRKGGRVVLFGGLPKANPMVSLDSNRIHYGEIGVVGAFSYHPRYHGLALDLLRRNVIGSQLVTHTFGLNDVAAAFAMADSGDALKVMVLV